MFFFLRFSQYLTRSSWFPLLLCRVSIKTSLLLCRVSIETSSWVGGFPSSLVARYLKKKNYSLIVEKSLLIEEFNHSLIVVKVRYQTFPYDSKSYGTCLMSPFLFSYILSILITNFLYSYDELNWLNMKIITTRKLSFRDRFRHQKKLVTTVTDITTNYYKQITKTMIVSKSVTEFI